MKTRVFLVLFLQIISLNGFTQLNDLIVDLELKLLKGQNDSVICISNDIINKDSCNAYAFYYKGKAFQSKYRFFDAEKSFEKAYMFDTTNRVFQNSLAEVLEAIGKDEEAIDLYYSQYLNDTLDISPIISLANIFRKKK